MNPMPAVDADILQTIPHRPPFLFLKHIESLKEGESLTAWMDNDPKAAHYGGHFPGLPVTPGVLILEALAQASCYLFAKTIHPPIGSQYLLGNVKIRFLNTASPQDKIQLKIKIERIISAGAIFNICARTEIAELVSGELGFICKSPKGLR
jgi:3-hydroxyacyl-[acyl-carrier-protein] dehydratase